MSTNIEHEQQVPLLDLKKVVKQVKTGSDELTILQGLDLQIKHGESLAIVGASGSGKSTLLGIMAGLDQSTSGEVWLNGQALHNLDEDQRAAVRADGVGFVFQNFQLLPALTALENRMTNLFEEIISFSEENDEDDMKNLIGASTQPALVNYLADEFFSEQYLRLPEEKIAKMFACMTVVGEALGEA